MSSRLIYVVKIQSWHPISHITEILYLVWRNYFNDYYMLSHIDCTFVQMAEMILYFFNFFVIHAISLLQNLCCTSCKISEVYLKVDKFCTNSNIMFVSLRAREYMHFVLQRNLGRVAHLSIVFPNCHCVRKEKWTVVWTSLYGLDILAMLYQSIVFLISWVICLLTCCKCYLTVPIVSIESLYVIWLSFNVHMQRSTCLLLVYLIVGKRGWVHATPS